MIGLLFASGGVVAADSIQPPTVPAAFHVIEFVSGLTNPTALALGPDGRLYIAELDGNILATDGDGAAVATIATGFDNPLGLAWYKNQLYVSSLGEISVMTPNSTYTVFSTPTTIVKGIPVGMHQNDEIVFNGGWLYMSVGSTCNACKETDPRSATIMRFKPNGADPQIYATGLRNSFGLAVRPATGKLYATDNGRNDHGDTIPDELNLIVQHGSYGWPDCWGIKGGSHCKGTISPVTDFPPHCSADGFSFYTGTTFPSSYDGDAFVAEYGNEHDSLPTGHIVQDVHFAAKKTTLTTFATGFENPVATLIGPDGSLVIADFGDGVIWRIQANGH